MEASTSLISRRSLTLYDQLSVVPHNSKNLRDLLKLSDSSDHCPNPNPNPSPNTTWRTLRDLLQLHTIRNPNPVPNPNLNPDPNPSHSTSNEPGDTESQPVRVSLMALLEQTERNANTGAQSPEGQVSGQEQSRVEGDADVRVSLMALLEQSERSLNWDGAHVAEGEEGHVAEEEGHVAEGEGLACVCCVCMVRRKGAAFIPCGHTFCRRCSRELHASRGTCPLCNGAIAEVLDIF